MVQLKFNRVINGMITFACFISVLYKVDSIKTPSFKPTKTPSFKPTKTPSFKPTKTPSMTPSQKIISASLSSNFLTGNSDIYSLAEGYSTLNFAIPYLTLNECHAQCLGTV